LKETPSDRDAGGVFNTKNKYAYLEFKKNTYSTTTN